jgi:hypothetical protein
MPTENKPAESGFDLSTPDGGRGYIAHLFKTELRRHDYRQYIAERLAGDFACTLAQHFEDVKAQEQALQLRLSAADQRIDELSGLMQALIDNPFRFTKTYRTRIEAALSPKPEDAIHDFTMIGTERMPPMEYDEP